MPRVGETFQGCYKEVWEAGGGVEAKIREFA